MGLERGSETLYRMDVATPYKKTHVLLLLLSLLLLLLLLSVLLHE